MDRNQNPMNYLSIGERLIRFPYNSLAIFTLNYFHTFVHYWSIFYIKAILNRNKKNNLLTLVNNDCIMRSEQHWAIVPARGKKRSPRPVPGWEMGRENLLLAISFLVKHILVVACILWLFLLIFLTKMLRCKKQMSFNLASRMLFKWEHEFDQYFILQELAFLGTHSILLATLVVLSGFEGRLHLNPAWKLLKVK